MELFAVCGLQGILRALHLWSLKILATPDVLFDVWMEGASAGDEYEWRCPTAAKCRGVGSTRRTAVTSVGIAATTPATAGAIARAAAAAAVPAHAAARRAPTARRAAAPAAAPGGRDACAPAAAPAPARAAALAPARRAEPPGPAGRGPGHAPTHGLRVLPPVPVADPMHQKIKQMMKEKRRTEWNFLLANITWFFYC